jgi:hypothetical protein
VQELAEWDPKRHPNTRPVPERGSTFFVKSISRALAATADTPVMVPMLQAFEAGNVAVLQGGNGQLDAPVTVSGVLDEVLLAVFTGLFPLCPHLMPLVMAPPVEVSLLMLALHNR